MGNTILIPAYITSPISNASLASGVGGIYKGSGTIASGAIATFTDRLTFRNISGTNPSTDNISIVLENPTTATSSTTLYSPQVRFSSNGFSSDTSSSINCVVSMGLDHRPNSVLTSPNFVLNTSYNNGVFKKSFEIDFKESILSFYDTSPSGDINAKATIQTLPDGVYLSAENSTFDANIYIKNMIFGPSDVIDGYNGISDGASGYLFVGYSDDTGYLKIAELFVFSTYDQMFCLGFPIGSEEFNNAMFTVNGKISSYADSFRIKNSKTPASASATGTQGDIAWDSSYIYVCVANNTWKRALISTW